MIDDLENKIQEMAEKQEETKSNLRELLKNEDTALRSKRLRELEAFKSLYRRRKLKRIQIKGKPKTPSRRSKRY